MRNLKQQLLSAYYFLVKGYSHRQIEVKVFNLEYKSRGGGFIAKATLDSLGLKAKYKGILKI